MSAANPGPRAGRVVDDVAGLRRILEPGRTIAVVGLSANWYRPSYFAAKYMMDHGYRVIPVNPACAEVLGQRCYPTIASIGEPVDIVDAFRRPADMPSVAREAVAARARVLWMQLGIESQNWTLSQFMHGEQGALICTAKIVETVPWIDAKYYASTQVMDEARHVEVFAKYLDTKLSGHYPVNAHLKMLLDDIVNDSRWDMTYLGMQIMVEGLALAAFGFMHQMTTEPLLKQLLRYVMSDEARHVAFGVLSLQEYYAGLSDAEIFERQQFAFEAAVRMRDRFLQQEVWERMDVPVKEAIELVMRTPTRQLFQMMLFSKIVPNCKKLGLLDRNDKWLRHRFEELGVIQFEDWVDTGDEYESFALTDAELRTA